VGDEVTKDEPLTTNPNVGGFGQEEKECILQDMNRVYAFCAFAFSCFIAQLSFVLKKMLGKLKERLEPAVQKCPSSSLVTMALVAPAFTVLSPTVVTPSFNQQIPRVVAGSSSHGHSGTGAALAACGMVAAAGLRRARKSYYRDHLVACRAQLNGADAPTPEETDKHMEGIQAFAKQALAGASAAMLFTSSMEAAVAYPIFAQQNYAKPREYTGKIVCANCHLASKSIEVRLPQAVLPDTIFKMEVEVPAKYAKRRQPLADGSKGPMNIGAIAVMPEGWKLAPKDRLPKPLKKEMKGLAWAPYSKEYPNIVVAGPVPGETYEKMVLPVLSPDPNTNDKVIFGKGIFYFGGNRGRGQVYPEGNQSNNNQFLASATGTISAIDGLKVSITTPSGEVKTQECLTGADIVVQVGDEVTKDEPITTNPNVGGFGQEEKECILQDMNRVYAFCAFAFSCFIAQLSFVLKKKQFEKVQLAEGAALAACGMAAAAGVRRAGRCGARGSRVNMAGNFGAFAKQALAGASAAMLFTSSMETAVAYPIFAQQNYANPREYTGKIVCANCHLASKPIEVRLPQAVLPDTIFKMEVEVPAKYAKRRQPLADGSKGPMNIGAIAVMPEGWKLAPKDRLPKPLKKEMKGLAWAPYSKEYPNIVVAGPVPGRRSRFSHFRYRFIGGETYEKMVLPVLSHVGNCIQVAGLGCPNLLLEYTNCWPQVYPEGNQSNNNQFLASATGTISAIDGLKVPRLHSWHPGWRGDPPALSLGFPWVNITTPSGEVKTQEEKECILQDMNRVYAFCAFAFSCFIAQLGFVLKWHFFEDACSASGKNCLDLLTSASLEAIDTGNQGTSKKLEEGPSTVVWSKIFPSAMALAPAFTVVSSPTGTVTQPTHQIARPQATQHGLSGTGAGLAACGLAAAAGVRRTRKQRRSMAGTSLVGNLGESYYRDHLVACRAQLNGVDAPTPEETDQHMEGIQAFAKQALAGASAAMLFTSSMEAAVAYPIFAQQNYSNPREYTGKIVCANCHLASKPIEVRLPQAVLPDTIFKMEVEVPAKYAKRRQPLADGSKGPMNIGAIAVMPEGWKLAPKDRLPKPLKKEMKGLAWAPYSKEYPNIVVAGPVPGETYEKMVLPVLSPDPNTNDKVIFGKGIFYFGGNRGRGQVYPEGNQSNNNQFLASATGTISAIDGLKVSITTPSGEVKTQECLTGADIMVQ
ncbi:unnamed protein product, partial [Cladocopium goreaui]